MKEIVLIKIHPRAQKEKVCIMELFAPPLQILLKGVGLKSKSALCEEKGKQVPSSHASMDRKKLPIKTFPLSKYHSNGLPNKSSPAQNLIRHDNIEAQNDIQTLRMSLVSMEDISN